MLTMALGASSVLPGLFFLRPWFARFPGCSTHLARDCRLRASFFYPLYTIPVLVRNPGLIPASLSQTREEKVSRRAPLTKISFCPEMLVSSSPCFTLAPAAFPFLNPK